MNSFKEVVCILRTLLSRIALNDCFSTLLFEMLELKYAKTEMQRLMASLFKRKAKRVDPFYLLD